MLCCYSRPIMAYLVNKYARNDSLYPKDPKQKAIVDQMMYFDADSLYSNLIKCFVCIELVIAQFSFNIIFNIFQHFLHFVQSLSLLYILYISTLHKF